jgi:hypothetical protein
MMAESQAQMPQDQTTVAEDAVAAAGVPQGGLADMAQAMAPRTDMDMNTGVAPVERMRDGGVVRMKPGGLTGNADLDEALKELEQARIRLATATRAARGDDSPLSEVSADVGSFAPAPISAAPMTPAGGLPGIDAMQNPLGRLRPTQPNTQMLVGPGADAAPTVDMAPPGPTQPEPQLPGSIEDAARMMELNDIGSITSPDVLRVLNELGIDPERFALLSPEEQQDILGYVDPTQGTRQAAAESYDPYVPPSINLGDIYTETLFPGYVETVEEGQRLIRDREAGLSFGDQFGDVDPALVRRGGADELTFGDIDPTGAPIPFALPIGEDEDADADVDVNAVVSGGGGTAAPATDDAFNQDKWLALAQAGLSLMASKQPTLGGAIGEAGLSGITALRQARGERDERIERQQARADRLAAAARERVPGYEDDVVGDLLKQRDLLEREASSYFDSELSAVRPGYEERYNRILQRIDAIDSVVGTVTMERFPGLMAALTGE